MTADALAVVGVVGDRREKTSWSLRPTATMWPYHVTLCNEYMNA